VVAKQLGNPEYVEMAVWAGVVKNVRKEVENLRFGIVWGAVWVDGLPEVLTRKEGTDEVSHPDRADGGNRVGPSKSTR